MKVTLCFTLAVSLIDAVLLNVVVHLLNISSRSFCSYRDVSSAGLVIANHQDIKSEIETRADSFTASIDMGNTLINNNHYAADEVLCSSYKKTVRTYCCPSLSLFDIISCLFHDSQIREKLTQLQEKRDKINKKWQDKMDHLQIGKAAGGPVSTSV